MKKANIVKVLYAVFFFVIAILLVVGAVVGEFDFGILDGIVYLAGGFALVSLLGAFLMDNKQGMLMVSGAFGLVCFGVAIAIGLAWYIAVVSAILYLGALFLIRALIFGGKNWDRGDNQKPGYKDYKTRKAEKELAEKPSEPSDSDKN